jgi:hypothetical protein
LESFLRCLLHQLSLPLGSRTLWPPCRLVFRDRQLFDGLILLLLRLLLLLLILQLTSRERGVGIVGVATAGGDAALVFLFFFCSAAFTAEIAVATAEADFFATVDLVLRPDFAAPTTGSTPLRVSVFVVLHRRVRLIILQQTTCWRLVLVRPQLPPLYLPSGRGTGHHIWISRIYEIDDINAIRST